MYNTLANFRLVALRCSSQLCEHIPFLHCDIDRSGSHVVRRALSDRTSATALLQDRGGMAEAAPSSLPENMPGFPCGGNLPLIVEGRAPETAGFGA
ncbi:hypothetical protein [Haematobacter genomosp. 1]|uniref:hypothetical protein n=1 Tax=Haematobacter genomosp. 1 TaxID=366618 RepID=UPI00117BDC4C|nr:hypothetical protein [Haematobacter genomosp. 1]